MRDDVYIERVLQKCVALSEVGYWESETRMPFRTWLENFEDPAERRLAALLLDNVLYFPTGAVDQLLMHAIRRIVSKLCRDGVIKAREWGEALAQVRFCPVQGDPPRVTDSGNEVCRRLKKLFRIGETSFLSAAEVVRHLESNRCVVLVDDVIATGNQLTKTLQADWPDDEGLRSSFEECVRAKGGVIACLTAFATRDALERLQDEFPEINVEVGHVLNVDETVFGMHEANGEPVTTARFEEVERFLSKHAPELQLPETLDKVEWRKFGFGRRGLLFACDMAVPDSTVPMLWAEKDRAIPWRALLTRS